MQDVVLQSFLKTSKTREGANIDTPVTQSAWRPHRSHSVAPRPDSDYRIAHHLDCKSTIESGLPVVSYHVLDHMPQGPSSRRPSLWSCLPSDSPQPTICLQHRALCPVIAALASTTQGFGLSREIIHVSVAQARSLSLPQ